MVKPPYRPISGLRSSARTIPPNPALRRPSLRPSWRPDMPTSMTFNSLLSDLRAYLERGSVVDQVVYNQLPTLINDAEREISRALKIEGFVQVVTSLLQVNTAV